MFAIVFPVDIKAFINMVPIEPHTLMNLSSHVSKLTLLHHEMTYFLLLVVPFSDTTEEYGGGEMSSFGTFF